VLIDRLIRRLNRKISRHRDAIVEVAEERLEDAEIGVVAYGSTARAARRAVMLAREEGIPAGLLRPLVLWPFPDKEVRALAEKVKCIIVPELNMGQVAHEVEWASCGRVPVHRVNRVDGEPIAPQQILQAIREVAK
jgi:2-oxoglutarate ferredoxin oxidoreductase subunit alpha